MDRCLRYIKDNVFLEIYNFKVLDVFFLRCLFFELVGLSSDKEDMVKVNMVLYVLDIFIKDIIIGFLKSLRFYFKMLSEVRLL